RYPFVALGCERRKGRTEFLDISLVHRLHEPVQQALSDLPFGNGDCGGCVTYLVAASLPYTAEQISPTFDRHRRQDVRAQYCLEPLPKHLSSRLEAGLIHHHLITRQHLCDEAPTEWIVKRASALELEQFYQAIRNLVSL